jgi:hypothetical protein
VSLKSRLQQAAKCSHEECDGRFCEIEEHPEMQAIIRITELETKVAEYEYPLRTNNWVKVRQEVWDELTAKRDKLKAMRPVDHRPLIGMIDRLEAEAKASDRAFDIVQGKYEAMRDERDDALNAHKVSDEWRSHYHGLLLEGDARIKELEADLNKLRDTVTLSADRNTELEASDEHKR